MSLAAFLVGAGRLYFVIGLISAILWNVRGMSVVEPKVTGMRWPFRLIILPACIFLWPITMWKWIQHGRKTAGDAS